MDLLVSVILGIGPKVTAISRWVSDLTKQVALVVDYSFINDSTQLYVQCTADHFKLELLKDTGSALDKYIHVCTLRVPKCSKFPKKSPKNRDAVNSNLKQY